MKVKFIKKDKTKSIVTSVCCMAECFIMAFSLYMSYLYRDRPTYDIFLDYPVMVIGGAFFFILNGIIIKLLD